MCRPKIHSKSISRSILEWVHLLLACQRNTQLYCRHCFLHISMIRISVQLMEENIRHEKPASGAILTRWHSQDQCSGFPNLQRIVLVIPSDNLQAEHMFLICCTDLGLSNFPKFAWTWSHASAWALTSARWRLKFCLPQQIKTRSMDLWTTTFRHWISELLKTIKQQATNKPTSHQVVKLIIQATKQTSHPTSKELHLPSSWS